VVICTISGGSNILSRGYDAIVGANAPADNMRPRVSRNLINFSVTFVAVPCEPLKWGAGMADTAGIPGDRIRSFIERVERIDEEIKALNDGKKEVFTEAVRG
jgi:hypothetical protein